MRNSKADAMGEDLLRAIQQVGCAELHAKSNYEKLVSEIDTGIVDPEDKAAVTKHLEMIEESMDDINSLATLRRSIMLQLFNLYDGGKEGLRFWCQLKHLGTASFCLFEAYQASNDDRNLLDLAIEANKQFNRAVSRFIGAEIIECSSCLGDYMIAKEGEAS